MAGMVLDVTRWLPEHPGGRTIIPKQALNLDCARFFEARRPLPPPSPPSPNALTPKWLEGMERGGASQMKWHSGLRIKATAVSL